MFNFYSLSVRTAPPGDPACWRRGRGCGRCGWGRASWPAGSAALREPSLAPPSERCHPARGGEASAARKNSQAERRRCDSHPAGYEKHKHNAEGIRKLLFLFLMSVWAVLCCFVSCDYHNISDKLFFSCPKSNKRRHVKWRHKQTENLLKPC